MMTAAAAIAFAKPAEELALLAYTPQEAQRQPDPTRMLERIQIGIQSPPVKMLSSR